MASMMRSNWFMVELPGKMGFPHSSSPSMQPAGAAIQVSSKHISAADPKHATCSSLGEQHGGDHQLP